MTNNLVPTLLLAGVVVVVLARAMVVTLTRTVGGKGSTGGVGRENDGRGSDGCCPSSDVCER